MNSQLDLDSDANKKIEGISAGYFYQYYMQLMKVHNETVFENLKLKKQIKELQNNQTQNNQTQNNQTQNNDYDYDYNYSYDYDNNPILENIKAKLLTDIISNKNKTIIYKLLDNIKYEDNIKESIIGLINYTFERILNKNSIYIESYLSLLKLIIIEKFSLQKVLLSLKRYILQYTNILDNVEVEENVYY